MRSVRRSVRLALGAVGKDGLAGALAEALAERGSEDAEDVEDGDDEDVDDDAEDDSLDLAGAGADAALAPATARGVSVRFLQKLRAGVADGSLVAGAEMYVAARDLGNGVKEGTRLKLLQREKNGECTGQVVRSEIEVHFREGKDAKKVPRQAWTTQDVADLLVLPTTMAKEASPFLASSIRAFGGRRQDRGAAFRGAFVCHARACKFADFVGALEEHFAHEDFAETFVWVDLISGNMPLWEREDADAHIAREAFIREGVHDMMSKFERLIVVLDRWDAPLVLQRLWCRWELFGAREGRDGDADRIVEAAFAPGQKSEMIDVLASKAGKVSKVLGTKMDARSARARTTLDDTMLQEAITETLGPKGFAKINSAAQSQHRKWLTSVARDAVAHARDAAHNDSLPTTGGLGLRLSTRLSALGSGSARKKKRLGILLVQTAEVLLGDPGGLDEAVAMYEEALNIIRETSSPLDPELVRTLDRLGSLYTLQCRFDDGIVAFASSVEAQKETKGRMHPDVASALNNLALLHSSIGEYDAALALFEEALEIQRGVLGAQHVDVADTLTNVALVYDSQGLYEDALRLFDEALKVLEKTHGLHHVKVVDALSHIALANRELGRFDAALRTYQAALEVCKEVRGAHHSSSADLMCSIAEVYSLQGRLDAAVLLYLDALRLYKDLDGQSSLKVSTTLTKIALVYADQDRFAEALDLLEEARSVCVACVGPRHPKVAAVWHNIGWVHRAKEDWAAALDAFEHAADIFEGVFGPDHADTVASQALVDECRVALRD
ncbi:Kinesin light chain [Hondaea fermentalgiana]|uniref:Kinesin light chain n=1 Tax=Hondaea fermentalgiana TaxID=2315210 RepID=A0A2R5GJP9_9STRA|nr:Kinesin light chain [Hondaea fermentalgiana]|eukprot:GBG28084.1 Kinesin light chain [Hondaea fermentalgiana]